jgi:hypothetical protein
MIGLSKKHFLSKSLTIFCGTKIFQKFSQIALKIDAVVLDRSEKDYRFFKNVKI